MKSIITLACVIFAAQAIEQATQTTESEWEPRALGLDYFNENVMKGEGSDTHIVTENSWFIKFFAPWCGHCKKLAPTWSEFNRVNMDELNVATVDCTSDEGKPLCSKMEVRGYPSLLFFPGKKEGIEGPTKAIKYSGQRTREAFEDFALNGGFKNVADDQKVPVNLSSMESWSRWGDQQVKLVQRDVDMAWTQYGLDAYIPPPYHYALAFFMCCTPFILVCAMLCCMLDEDDDEPARPAKVAPKSPQSKKAGRAEKLD